MLIYNQKDLNEVLDWLKYAEYVVVDIETTSLNPRTGSILGIGLSDGTTSYYLVHQAWSGQLEQVLSVNDIIGVLFLLIHRPLITHNGAFDLSYIKNYFGIDLVHSLHADTTLLVHTCDENRFSYRLKDMAAEYFGADVKAEQQLMLESIKRNGGAADEYYKADTDLMGRYCIQDCILTFKLFQKFSPVLKQDGLEKFFYEDEVMPLYKLVTIPMQQHGVSLNIEAVKSALEDINNDLKTLEQSIQSSIAPHLEIFTHWFLNKDYPASRSGEFAQYFAKLHNLNLPKTKTGSYSLSEKAISGLPDGYAKGVLSKTEYMSTEDILSIQQQMWADTKQQYMFNLSSRHHLKKLLFDTLKETPLNRTPTGQPQADEELLDTLRNKYEWVPKLIEYYKLQKIKGTYIERFLNSAEGDKFYPQWKQHGTQTGRFSGDLQQLPRALEEGQASELITKHTNRIRSFFVPQKGNIYIDADYNSLEPHVFAHISKDPDLLQIFDKKLDFYSQIAIKTEKLTNYSADKKAPNYLGKLNKAKRQTAKGYALGLAYGMEDYKLHIELGISQEEAKLLANGYWSGFPVLKQVSDQNKQQIMQEGFIRSETGRMRRVPEAKRLSDKYGTKILDSLQLWKDYHEIPTQYEQMKKHRKTLKNCLNLAINFPTQSLAASIVNRSAIALAKALDRYSLDAKIVMLVHDEVLLECPESQLEKTSKILQDCLENTYKISLKLTAEPSTGYNYSEAK